jgi:hypothetical protein
VHTYSCMFVRKLATCAMVRCGWRMEKSNDLAWLRAWFAEPVDKSDQPADKSVIGAGGLHRITDFI